MIILEAVLLIFGGLLALIIPLSWLGAKARQKRIKEAYNFNPSSVHGGARFAKEADLDKAGMFKKGGIHIGFFGGRKLFVNFPPLARRRGQIRETSDDLGK